MAKPQFETYGAPYDPKAHQIIYELLWFGRGGSENLSKQEHFKNICRLGYPRVANNWHRWYEMCLDAWCNYDELGMTGCAAAHKTFMFTLLGLTEWLAAPHKTRLILTAPTVPSLRGGVWARIKEAYQEMQGCVGRLPYNMVDSKTTLQFKKGDDENAVIAVAVDSGSIEQSIGRIQGKHPARVVILIDEAAQTQPAIFFARSNLRTGTQFYRCAAIANAVDQFDAHGVFCEPKGGYGTISVEDETWETKTGICLHFDGTKSPNVQLGEKRYPKLFSHEDLEQKRRDHGENSREWWMYVRGFWPPTGLQDTVMDGAMINSGGARNTAQWQTGFKAKAFLDPAHTVGGDRCILRFAKFGNLIEGPMAMALWDRIHIQLIEDPANPKAYQICDRVIKECGERGVKPSDFGMDVTGAATLADMLEQRWGGAVHRLSFGGAASDRTMSSKDSRPAKKVCANKVTELWYRAARMVQDGLIRQMDVGEAREFCIRRMKLMGERKVVETKADMKERTKGISPDDADAVVGLCDMFANEHGGEAKAAGGKARTWEQQAKRYNLVESYAG
jgi:hypothetical protein